MSNYPVLSVTVGILTHNYGRYIRQAIDSVLAQTRTDWELIISDDASTDDTSQIVAPYLNDPRIRYVRHEQNLGQSGNWAFLLGQGTAPLLAVLHADDSWLPTALDQALTAFAAEPELDLFYGNWWRQVEGRPGRVLAKQEKPHLFSGMAEYGYQTQSFTCLPSAAFVTRRVIRAAGKPHPGLRMVVDYEYFLRVCVNARKVQAVAEPLTLYRVHPSSTTADSTASGVFAEEREWLPKICSDWAKGPEMHRGISVLTRTLAVSLFSEGVGGVVHGETKEGRKLMRRGIKLSPALIFNPKVLVDCLRCAVRAAGHALVHRLHGAHQGKRVETA